MRPYSKILNGLLPVVLIITGAILRLRNATAFLGLVAFGLAAIALCYRILHLFSCKYKKVIRICSMVLTILLIVGFLVVCVTGAFIGSATSGDRKDDLAYIVVLGAKVNGTAPSRTLRERIDAAADYLHENPNTIAVVSGGQGSDEGISEAQCIYNGLVQRGVASERIWLEDRATSTWENLNFSLELIQDKAGFRPKEIGLVTSDFHLYRGKLFAKKCGIQAYGISGRTENRLYFFNYYLREIAGVWHYIILGN